jgi:hypothetical protein
MTTPIPTTITELLATRGLVPVPITLAAYPDSEIAELRRTWDAYRDRANEMRRSVIEVAGLACACADVLRCQHDEAMVLELRPLIAVETLTAAQTIKRADLMLAYFLAARPPASA